MGKKRSELDSLYRSISEKFDVGTFEEFSNKMQTPEDRKRFYEVVLDRGIDLGDYSEYERRLGGVQGVSAQGSAGTSETSGLPSSSSEEPLLGSQPAQVPVAPTPEQVGESVTDFEAQQIANVGNRYTDRYVPEDSTVVTPINTSAGPSVAVLGDDGEIFNVIPPVDVVTQIPFDVSMRNTFSNLKHQIEGIDDRLSLVAAETWEKLLGKELAKSWYDFSDRDIRQVKLDAYAELDRLESEMKQTASITGSLKAGDALGFLAASVNALSALGTTAIASISTGGVGLYTEMMGQSIYDFNKTRAEELGLTIEQLYDQGKAEFGVPATIGILGGALEKVGFKGATRAFLAQLNSNATRKLVKAGLGANQEGVTEWLQTGLEAVNQMYAENPEASTFDVAEAFAKSLFSEEGLESYLMGAIGSASASGIGRATSHVVSRMVDRKRARDVENKMESIQAINQDLENTDMSPATATALESERERLVSEVAEDISADAEQESQLSPEVRSEVEGLMGRLEELQSAIHDPNVSEETKSLLQSQAEQVSSQIDSLISAEPESEAVADQTTESEAEQVSEVPQVEQSASEEAETAPVSDEVSSTETTPQQEAEATTPQSVEQQKADIERRRQESNKNQLNEIGSNRFLKLNKEGENTELSEVELKLINSLIDRMISQGKSAKEINAELISRGFIQSQATTPAQIETYLQSRIDGKINSKVGESISQEINAKYDAELAALDQQSQPTAQSEQATVDTPVEPVAEQELVEPVQETDTVTREPRPSETAIPRQDMPPNPQDNPRLKSLIRMLPRQDTAEMIGPANVEYRRDVIESITGERPTKKDAGITNVRRAIADYLGINLENTSGVNFADMVRNWANSPDSSPKKSSRTSRQANRYVNSDVSDSGASTLEEVTREFAKRTDDPDLIADAYNYVTSSEPDYIEEGIANYLGGGRINRRDFNSFGDRNRSSQSLASRWLDASDSQLGLDAMAQELSDQLGVEVTEQDFIDFVERYSGQQAFNRSKKSEEQIILEDKYAELTGRTLTPRIAQAAQRRLDSEITDRDLLESSPVFRELGITYEDVLDYEEFHRQSDQGGAENVPSQESVGSTAVADGGTRPQGAKAKTPKTLLKGVADRLSKTGLAKSVKIMTSEEISEDLDSRSDASVYGKDVNGYIDADGNIVINSDTASLDTPIHEFSHAWERTVETQNPFLHQRGMELIQSEEGKPYVDHVKKTQPSLTGRALYKEALAQAIGDRGARLIESQKNSPIKQWLKDAWDFIAKMVGLSDMTASQVSKLTLQEFADAVAVDLLSGKPFAKMPNGDVVVKTEATSEGNMDEADRFMAEFMERMRKRNGITFQGNISSSLSPQDFRDLTTFFRHAKSKGLISGIADARALAVAMNIANVSQVDMAFKLSEFAGKGVTGFKKSEVSAETIANTKFDKISDSKYREIGRDLVESGVVNPTELVDDLIHNRRVPLPEEVAALQYYSTQLDNQRNEIRDLVRKGTKEQVDKFSYQGESGYNALSIKADALSQARFDLEVAMLQSAHLQASAFRLRSVMSDKDFNIVTYLAEMKARGYVDPDVEKRLIELSAELESVRAKLREKMEEAEKKSDEIGFDNIKQEASKPEPKRRRVKPRKEVVEKVTQVLDSLDVTSFGLPGMNFQANGTIRFQVNPNTSVADSVQRAVAQMKASIAEGVNIGEAIETAIDAVSSEVGAENWDSVKFRSVVTNQLVQEEVSFKSRKPYVDSSGQLIVPGEYLKSLVRSGTDTIDGMVEAVNAEMGGSFSPYDIQNAISGYGRQAASKRSDLDRKISKARRIARLMSAVEDLQEKGTRVKTRKAASENDTRINELLDTIKKLEYDLEMTPEERSQYYTKRKNESRRKYLENYISEVEERIRNKDFEPVSHVNTYEKDQETLDLEQEAQRIRNEFKKEKYRHELETRSVSEKIRSIAYDIIFNILRGLTAGADASAVGVQGAIITAARPGYMAKTFIDTLGKTFSEAEYDAYFETLQSDPFFEMARKAKLNLQLPSFYQSVQEEQYKGQFPELIWNSFVSNPVGWAAGKITGKDTKMMREVLADKANPFTLGDRNYSLVLSQIRMDLFREFITNQINKQGLNTELDTKTIEQVAEMVNTLTMASKVPVFTGKLGNDILSATLFSARKLIATWKVLGAWAPLLVGSNRNPQLLYDAYGKILLKGLGTMFAVSALPIATAGLLRSVGDDDEEEEDFYFDNKNFFNPIHSDFMKIRLGDTRISLFQGIDGNIIFLSRFASNHYMTSSSQGVKRLDGQQGRNTRGRLILDYMRNKLAPTPSLAVNALGDDRDKQEGVQRFRDSFMPMWASGIREQYDSTGDLPETMFLGAAGFFGLSFNNYGGAEFAKPNGTDNAKVLELYSKSGLGAYDPTPNTRTAFDGKRVSKVGGSEFKDKYLPAYQEYMTQVSLSLRHKISTDKHWEHKEGVVDNWKREAYKYAEIKTTGVYVKDRFDRFSKNGTEYRLTESQYALKAGYIKEFMEGSGARKELRGVRANVRAKLRAEGAQSTATPEYTQMLIDLQLYNKANSYANERLYQDMRRRKIKLVTSADFTSDMNELPEE